MPGRFCNSIRQVRALNLRPFDLWLGAVLLLLYFSAVCPAFAKENEGDGPRICLIAPLGVPAGSTSVFKIRGLKLAESTALSFPPPASDLKVQIKEKKATDVPAGLEAKDAGDSLVVAEVEIPVSLAGSELIFRVITPEGTTAPRPIRVVEAGVFVVEKEPNDGFRNAQPLPFGKRLFGAIGADKDVDVFAVTGHAGKVLAAEVFAARAGSLLDGVLTLYDAKGRLLLSNDDSHASRDPEIRFKLPADGTYFLALQDASDHGTPWHSYELSAKEDP